MNKQIESMRKTRIKAVAWGLGMLVASACHAAGADMASAPAEWVDDLRPITAADWTRDRAAHLQERAGFGALPAEVQHSLALGPRAAVAALVRPQGTDDAAVRAFERSVVLWAVRSYRSADAPRGIRQRRQ